MPPGFIPPPEAVFSAPVGGFSLTEGKKQPPSLPHQQRKRGLCPTLQGPPDERRGRLLRPGEKGREAPNQRALHGADRLRTER